MYKKAKLAYYHALMFVWMVKHEFHSKLNHQAIIVDYHSADNNPTTIIRCLQCGETMEFSSK